MMKLGRFISLIGSLALVLTVTAAWAQPGIGPAEGSSRASAKKMGAA